jgi:hypothetical protein
VLSFGCPLIGSCIPLLGVLVFTTLVEMEILGLIVTQTPSLPARFGFIYWLHRSSKAKSRKHCGICVELRLGCSHHLFPISWFCFPCFGVSLLEQLHR